jgi:hypothetical protein
MKVNEKRLVSTVVATSPNRSITVEFSTFLQTVREPCEHSSLKGGPCSSARKWAKLCAGGGPSDLSP